MQLTDKVLLPATISYIDDGQHCTSQCAVDAAPPSDPCQSELAVETSHSVINNTAAADDGGGSKVEEADSTTCFAEVAVSGSAVHTVTVTGCVEASEPTSASDQVSLYLTDTDGTPSLMTSSVVDFSSEAGVCDAIHLSAASLLPTPVHIGDTLLQSADTDDIMTDSAAVASSVQLTGCSDEDMMNSVVSNNDDCSQVQHPTKWTR